MVGWLAGWLLALAMLCYAVPVLAVIAPMICTLVYGMRGYYVRLIRSEKDKEKESRKGRITHKASREGF
jgi:hypothetical protein